MRRILANMKKKHFTAFLASALLCASLAVPMIAHADCDCGPDSDEPHNVLVPQQYLTAFDYNGSWYRTDVPSSENAKLFIKAIDEGSFTYHLICAKGEHICDKSGRVVLNSRGMGVENVNCGNAAEGNLVFKTGDGEIFIDFMGDLSALGFDHGVTPVGTYVKTKPAE